MDIIPLHQCAYCYAMYTYLGNQLIITGNELVVKGRNGERTVMKGRPHSVIITINKVKPVLPRRGILRLLLLRL